MPESITVVVLGDAGTGKSDLLTRLTGNEAPKVEYQPTIGAELTSTTFTFLDGSKVSRDFEVTFWEFPGNERFLAPFGSQLIQADLCLLVCDVCVEETLHHLDKWHDEYLQSSHLGGVAPASFILVGNKLDVDKEYRTVNSDKLAGWCSREMIDPTLWPKEIIGDMLPAPPFVEVSARTGAGIEVLKTQILQRGSARARLNYQLPANLASLEIELVEHEAIGKGAVRCIFMGESESAKDSLLFKDSARDVVLPEVERLETSAASFAAFKHTSLSFAIWTAPNTQTSGPIWYCRGSHICVMTLHLGIQAVTHRLALWKEIFLRESCLRDSSGILWLVVGKRTPGFVAEASSEAAEYCQRNGYNFIELPEDPAGEYMLSVWDSIATLAENHRKDRVIERTEEQVQNLIAVCPNKENGCPWRGKARDAPNHFEQLCAFAKVKCRYGCEEEINRGERVIHEKFCKQRPPTCHFCDTPYATTLVEHLKTCVKKEEFENTHVKCPLADFGCPVTYVKRNEVASHIQGDAPRHMELLATGLQHIRSNMLTMERNQTMALQNLGEVHQQERLILTSELEATKTELSEAKGVIKDMKIEMNLMWQELEALKAGRTI